MAKSEEEVVAEFKEIIDGMSPTEQAFIRAAFTGEGLDEAVDDFLEEEGWGEPYGPLVICTDEGCPCDK